MEDSAMSHRVAVLAVPPVVGFDLMIPSLVLGLARIGGRRVYEVRLHTADPGAVETIADARLLISRGLDELVQADTVIVPGTRARHSIDPRVRDALRAAAAAGARMVSVCTGAFVLAMAGLLDGLRATTHWLRAEEFSRRFPQVSLDPCVLYVDEGKVCTSAGLAAGIDLCLHLIRKDFGSVVANQVARYVVVAPVRAGGQAQFISTPLPGGDGQPLEHTRAWARQRLDQRLSLDDLAQYAQVSVRTLTRRFRTEIGLSPLQWLLHERIEHARELLESTPLSVERVARLSGLGSADSLRVHLKRQTGLTPTAYRTAFTRHSLDVGDQRDDDGRDTDDQIGDTR
jgi:transcriptional regulator GlxA family with amidase domain